MINNQTLTKYLSKMFTKQFLFTSAIILCVLFITSAFDILQKFKSTNITPGDFWKLVSFKIPYLFNEVASLICFISTFMFLRTLTKQNELVVILSSGIPIWKVFINPILVTFILGALILGIINPVGTYGLQEYEKLEAKLHNTPHLNFIISPTGLFFFEKFAGNNYIIQAKSINADKKTLTDVTILLVDEHNNLIKRIDSPLVQLQLGIFKLNSPVITKRTSSRKLKELILPTNLSIDNLVQRFSPPEMIPIWNLNNSIKNFARSGLVVTKYQIHYYKQLFKPLSMVAMSFIACWFVSLNIRDNSSARMAVWALITGICTYFFLEICLLILAYNGLHPVLATLLPILFIILISNFVILHFQEA